MKHEELLRSEPYAGSRLNTITRIRLPIEDRVIPGCRPLRQRSAQFKRYFVTYKDLAGVTHRVKTYAKSGKLAAATVLHNMQGFVVVEKNQEASLFSAVEVVITDWSHRVLYSEI